MSFPLIYIEEIRSTGGGEGKRCPKCGGPASRSMCEFHLVQAKMGWRYWTAERLAKGKCVKCNHVGQRLKEKDGRRGVHCARHRELNRQNCSTWMRANYRRRMNERKAAGVCIVSPTHGPVEKPHVYCAGCRQRQRKWGKEHREARA